LSKKAILVITDGVGYSPTTQYNAFYNAKKPTYDSLFKNVPYSLIDTFGLSVGLPEGQMGNSEVGHMTIGSGRILYQDLVKISLALSDGTINDNEVFQKLLGDSKRLHLIGLISDGGVHSHIDHFMAIADIAASKGLEVYLHLITDGRDVSPTSAPKYIAQVQTHLGENVKIASIGGRFYGMDRDNRWDRVQAAYDAMVYATPKTDMSVEEYVQGSYGKNETDEFISPVAFEGYDGFAQGDGVLCINFRSDRVREITSAIGDPDFVGFERDFIKTSLVTMTEYEKSFPYPVLFRKEVPKNTLAEVISSNGLRQLHTAETEKYAHVTFFFNGGVDAPYPQEERVLIPSPKVKTYDMQPQMSAPEVCEAVLKGMDDDYDFIVVNFANGDMVGHTGNFKAAVQAMEAVDAQLGRIIQKAKEKEYSFVLTSDHGNCEKMKDDQGHMLTNHTVGAVWCFVMAEGVTKVDKGGLNNIAPTLLKLMGLQIPEEMDKPLI
jgi:2,3-bisphosphoglycerate-independent phosphoglycerate mutase